LSPAHSRQQIILKSKKKYLSLRRIFVEYKNEEKTQNFSKEQEFSYRKQIARQLLTQYVESIYYGHPRSL